MNTAKLFYQVSGEDPVECTETLTNALLKGVTLIDVEALHSQGAVFLCSCNKLPPKMHLRKRDGQFHLVNDKNFGSHSVDCRFASERKTGGLSRFPITREQIAKLILSAPVFSMLSRKRSKYIYEDWGEAKDELYRLYPFMYGYLHFDARTNPIGDNWVAVSITKDKDKIQHAKPLGTSNRLSEGPWVTMLVMHKGQSESFAVPVYSFTNPMVIKHELERKHIKALLKQTARDIESGFWPQIVAAKKVKALAFVREKGRLIAYLPPSEKANVIAARMNAWNLKGLTVHVINDK